MTNYKSVSLRINKAENQKDIEKLVDSLDNLYNNGIFTISEFERLDDKIFKKSLTVL